MKTIEGIDFQAGTMLLVNKPMDWTSFDVVNKLRFCIKRKLGVKKIKVGHAGTLDPKATGLLIICTGKWTKKLDSYQAQYKEYTGTIKLGETTPSYDQETEVDNTYPTEQVTPALLESARAQFEGDLEQLPPMYSAIKVNGQPLYKKARKGIMVEVKPRPITIHEFELTGTEVPNIDFRCKCSKGTYIRTLAYDFGKAVDSGAYLSALHRSAIGEYLSEDAWEVDDLVKALEVEA